MNKPIVIKADGETYELDSHPTLERMQEIVGGDIEYVRVLDHVKADGQGFYVFMIVNESGLIDGLPRNEKATEHYQRNVKTKFPDDPNPFKTLHEKAKAQAESEGITYITAQDEAYHNDPYICGDVIYFPPGARQP